MVGSRASRRRRQRSTTDGSLSVLLDGELFGVKPGQRAAAAAHCFQRGGAASVSALNGSFSAVFFEHAERRATIASDAIGARSLRYLEGATFAVSARSVARVRRAARGRARLDLRGVERRVRLVDRRAQPARRRPDRRRARDRHVAGGPVGAVVRAVAREREPDRRGDRAGLRQTLESMVEAMGA